IGPGKRPGLFRAYLLDRTVDGPGSAASVVASPFGARHPDALRDHRIQCGPSGCACGTSRRLAARIREKEIEMKSKLGRAMTLGLMLVGIGFVSRQADAAQPDTMTLSVTPGNITFSV